MTIVYESRESRERVEHLHRKNRLTLFGIELSSMVAGGGITAAIAGYFKKNETLKTSGWIAAVVGLTGVVGGLLRSMKINRELREPENTSVLLEGKPLRTGLVADIGNALDPRAPIQGQLADDIEIVQSREAWEKRMAEQKIAADKQPSK